jgi:DeoR family transcriptional regulator of aga operon
VLVERAKRVIVLADASKIGHVALAPVCELAQVDILLTDDRLPQPAADELATYGCAVLRA